MVSLQGDRSPKAAQSPRSGSAFIQAFWEPVGIYRSHGVCDVLTLKADWMCRFSCLMLPWASRSPDELLHRRYGAFYRPIPHRNAWQWFKLAMGSVILLPVRLAAGFTLLVSMWASCRLLSLGAEVGDQGLVSEWRRTLLRGMVKRAARVMLFILGFYSITENRLTHGQEDLANQIIVCNHVSYLV